MGLNDGEFWRLTPRQFTALLERHRERIEHDQLLAGIVASTVANFSMNPPKDWSKPSDYMPSQWRKTADKRRERKTASTSRKKIADHVRAFLSAQVVLRKDKKVE